MNVKNCDGLMVTVFPEGYAKTDQCGLGRHSHNNEYEKMSSQLLVKFLEVRSMGENPPLKNIPGVIELAILFGQDAAADANFRAINETIYTKKTTF